MRSLQVLRQNRAYIWVAAGLFLVGAVLGLLFADEMMKYVASSLDKIKDLAETAQAKNNPAYTSLLLFKNNLSAAVYMLCSGVLLGVVTALSLVLNGLMVGVVFAQIGGHGSLWLTILFGLVPHGIFELPAIFISAAFGLKLGRCLLVPLREMTRWQSVIHVGREVWSISWVIVLLLVVAASVEGAVTPVLLHTFVTK
ncbi:MAG: stage II sporulation protein M [Tumebacillaceae bacterium]